MTTPAVGPSSSAATWPETVAPAAVERSLKRGLTFVDAAVLGLVALVVLLVSLPRLREFALRENELDAIRALRVLSEDAALHADALAAGDLGALLAASPDHRVRLEDVEVLAGGRLRCHGYLFAAALADGVRPVLVAWPWEHGSTGIAAFAIEPGGEPLGLRNDEGIYSGPNGPLPPPPGLSAEWIAIPRE